MPSRLVPFFLYSPLLVIFTFTACWNKDIPPPSESSDPASPLNTAEARLAQARLIAESLEDSALASQVLIAGIEGNAVLSEGMRMLLRENPPGAVMLFSYNVKADAESIRVFLEDCVEEIARVAPRPFIAVDHEGGLVHRFGKQVRRLPSAQSYRYRVPAVGEERVVADIEYQAYLSALELRALGVTMNFAPVAEPLTPENADFLDGRSYGGDAVFVEKACAAFIRGMGKAGVACVVKHFPGDADADPHKALPILRGGMADLDALVQPFAGLFKGGEAAGVMISHVLVWARDPERNASLSPLIMQGWLRAELGFKGIAVADDFTMGAASFSGASEENAAVLALNAGADMVMAWPRSLASTHRAILKALAAGLLSRERLRSSASRILYQKLRFGVMGGGAG